MDKYQRLAVILAFHMRGAYSLIDEEEKGEIADQDFLMEHPVVGMLMLIGQRYEHVSKEGREEIDHFIMDELVPRMSMRMQEVRPEKMEELIDAAQYVGMPKFTPPVHMDVIY